MNFQETFQEAINDKKDQFESLRQTLIQLRNQGVSKQVLLAELEEFSKHLGNESDEDVVFDALDLLLGNCAPAFRIE